MKQIQEWLGHSNFSNTKNFCGQLEYQSKMDSAQALEQGADLSIITEQNLENRASPFGEALFWRRDKDSPHHSLLYLRSTLRAIVRLLLPGGQADCRMDA